MTRTLVLGVLATLLLAGCGANADETIAFVPSSFTDVTEAVDANRDDDPNWFIAGSARLLRQLTDGADADLLITADQATMDVAVGAGLVTTELGVVARNRLVLAVAPGNPAGISGVADLADPDHVVGICEQNVPCGRVARTALDELAIALEPDTEEASVRLLSFKIQQAELDAGLIYATDALSLDLATIDDDRLAPFTTDYPAASVDGGDSEIVDYLRSVEGQAILTGLGFEVP